MPGIGLTDIEDDFADIVPLWRFIVVLPDVVDYQGNSVVTPKPIRIQKFTISTQTISDESEPIAQWAKHFPTTSTVDSGQLTMFESGGKKNPYESTKYWKAWQSLVHDVDGNFGLPIDYWKTVKLYSLDVQGNVLCRFDVIESFPTHAGTHDFDGASPQEMYNMVTLACTNVTINPTNKYP